MSFLSGEERAELFRRVLDLWAQYRASDVGGKPVLEPALRQAVHQLHTVASNCGFEGELGVAFNLYSAILDVFLSLDDNHAQVRLLNEMGQVYFLNGHPKIARDTFEKALVVAREAEGPGGEGKALIYLCTIYRSLGDPQAALGYLRRALPLLQQESDRYSLSVVHQKMGEIYHELHQHVTALQHFLQAQQLEQGLVDAETRALTLHQIAKVYRSLGQGEECLKKFQESLQLYREAGDKGGEGTVLQKMGEVFLALQRHDEALDCFSRALQLLPEEVDIWLSKAETLEALGRRDDAITCYRRILELAPDSPLAREALQRLDVDDKR